MEIIKVEKFAIVIIILWLVTLFVSPFLFNIIFLNFLDLETFSALSTMETTINLALLFLRHIVEFAIGVWLFFHAKSMNSAKWLWLMLGFVFGINAVILYYLIQYIDSHKSKKEINV